MDGMDMSHFIDISPAMQHKHKVLGTSGASVSLFLCSCVLGSSLWIWTHKRARQQLNRVSFKLLLWAMGAQVIYDIIYIFLYSPSSIDLDHAGCGAAVLFRLAAIGIVNYLCTCIAINLTLTITLGINPVERKLLRLYVGVSVFLGIIIPTVPACMHHFGWDPVFNYCYFTGSEEHQRVRHLVLDLYLWQGLSCLIATVAVVVTLCTLFKQSRHAHRIEDDFHNLNRRSFLGQTNDEGGRSNRPRTRFTLFRGRRASISSEDAPSSSSLTMYQLQDKFLSIALRISLYPICLIIVNTILTVGDLYTAIHGTGDYTTTWRFLCFYTFLYGGRGVVFALLCIFVDPCLARGFKAVFEEKREKSKNNRLGHFTDFSNQSTPKEKDMESFKAASPAGPMVAVASYSPTYIPPGEEPATFEEPLAVPEIPEIVDEFEETPDEPTFEEHEEAVPVEVVIPASRVRSDSNRTMGMDSILNCDPTEMSRKRNESTMTLDMTAALSSTPVLLPRGRQDSTVSMDMGQALSMPSRFLGTGSIGTLGSGKTVTHPSISSFQSGKSGRTSGSNPSMDISAALASTLPYSQPNLSAVSMDMSHALSINPEKYCPRVDSTLSMDITQALTLQSIPSIRSDDESINLDLASTSSRSTSSRTVTDPRRPSLPRLWKGAFDSDPYTAPPPVRAGRRIRVEPHVERKRMEWVKGMEKLFEEAEAQL